VVGHRHAQHLADDPHRQGVGQFGHDVELAPLECGVKQLGHDGLGSGPEAIDHLRGERLGHEAPQACVVRRVPEQEGAVVHLGLGQRAIVVGHGSAQTGRRHLGDIDLGCCPRRHDDRAEGPGSQRGGSRPRTLLASLQPSRLAQLGVQRPRIACPLWVGRVVAEHGAIAYRWRPSSAPVPSRDLRASGAATTGRAARAPVRARRTPAVRCADRDGAVRRGEQRGAHRCSGPGPRAAPVFGLARHPTLLLTDEVTGMVECRRVGDAREEEARPVVVEHRRRSGPVARADLGEVLPHGHELDPVPGAGGGEAVELGQRRDVRSLVEGPPAGAGRGEPRVGPPR